MNVNFKEKIVRLRKDASFEDFKHEILKNEKLVIKNFFYEDKTVTEYRKRKYRCKNCLKYFKETEEMCSY